METIRLTVMDLYELCLFKYFSMHSQRADPAIQDAIIAFFAVSVGLVLVVGPMPCLVSPLRFHPGRETHARLVEKFLRSLGQPVTLLNSEPATAQTAWICATEQVPGRAGSASSKSQAAAETEAGMDPAVEVNAVTGVGWWRLLTMAPSAP